MSTKKAKALLAAASPGPWWAGPPMAPGYEDHGWRRLAMMSDKKTCIFGPKGEWQLDWPHEANAQLQARAPDILAVAIQQAEALEDADCAYDHATYCHPGMDCLESRFCDAMCSRCLALTAWKKLEEEMP